MREVLTTVDNCSNYQSNELQIKIYLLLKKLHKLERLNKKKKLKLKDPLK